jgi:hypothetical protein
MRSDRCCNTIGTSRIIQKVLQLECRSLSGVASEGEKDCDKRHVTINHQTQLYMCIHIYIYMYMYIYI